MSNNCSICCESFTKLLRKPVTCCACDAVCCMTCAKRYLTESIVTEARCMSCNEVWGRKYLSETFSHSWLHGNFSIHTAEIVGDREISRLQVSNDIAVMERNRRIAVASGERNVSKLDKAPKSYAIMMRQYRYKISMESQEEKVAKSMPGCKINDCRGFLNPQWHCDLCDTDVCKSCRETKCSGHVCNPDTLETMKMLKTDTKDCPSCSASIFKIDGCDQMWCTQCHTSFSWISGKVVTSNVHNPHYFEYMRANGGMPRQNGDVAGDCNIPDPDADVRHIIHIGTPEIVNIYRNVTEIGEYNANPPPDYTEIHVKYILGDYSLQKFRSVVNTKETNYMFMRDNLQVVDTFLDVAEDAFMSVINHAADIKPTDINLRCDIAMVEIERIRSYCKDQFMLIGTQFNRKPFEMARPRTILDVTRSENVIQVINRITLMNRQTVVTQGIRNALQDALFN
jgi:hypothetical protein